MYTFLYSYYLTQKLQSFNFNRAEIKAVCPSVLSGVKPKTYV